MKNNRSGIFKRISVFIFLIITLLSAVCITINYFASTYFFNVSTELLNRDVAAHIAKFTSPFEDDTINRKKADSVFYNAMVLNPNAEVYFLNAEGDVMYYYANDSAIKMHKIPLDDIKKYIAANGEKYFTAYDPKTFNQKKIFSATPVYKNERLLGYIYVILHSSKYGSVNTILVQSHAWQAVLIIFTVVILISFIVTIYYVRRLQSNYKKIIGTLNEYKSGNFEIQFPLKDDNEFAPITQTFKDITLQLASSIQKLQKSEADRKDFIAIISHDLQSPLSIVRGYAETLLIQNNPVYKEEHLEYLKLIQLKIIQIEKMVNQLTELSKIDEVNFKPNKEPFVLSEIVQETVHTFQLSAMEKKLDLKCTQCQYHVWVEGDVSMMERVVQNLIDNTIKHTPADCRIQVSLSVEDNFLIFTIENECGPLSAELLNWINSSHLEISERPAHTGLGLLIVKRILQVHNTSLHAYVTNGKNVFSFKMKILPLKKIEQDS